MTTQQEFTIVVTEQGAHGANCVPATALANAEAPVPGEVRGPQAFCFRQDQDETAFLLDLRVREELHRLRNEGSDVSHAVLVWHRAEQDAAVLRRINLLVRYLAPKNGLLLLNVAADAPRATFERLRRIVAQHSAELIVRHGIVLMLEVASASSRNPLLSKSPAKSGVQTRLRSQRSAEA